MLETEPIFSNIRTISNTRTYAHLQEHLVLHNWGELLIVHRAVCCYSYCIVRINLIILSYCIVLVHRFVE